MITLAISGFFAIAFASWQFNSSDNTAETANVGITSWSFGSDLPISEGDTIEISNNGTVTINGETVEAEISYPDGNPSTGGGTVSMEIGVVDGELAVTEYAANNIANNWFSRSATLSFPASIEIDGVTYPILGLSEPVTLDISGTLLSRTIAVNVPEGYKYICDEVFQNVSCDVNTTINFSLPSTLEYLGYHAFKFGVNRLTENISYAGTTTQFKELVTNSATTYGSGYTFFSGATGNISITCSGGTVVYDKNGNYVSG